MKEDDAREWGAASQWTVQEMGWVIEETEEYLVFATRHKAEDAMTYPRYGHLQKIPKTWIRKRILLNAPPINKPQKR